MKSYRDMYSLPITLLKKGIQINVVFLFVHETCCGHSLKAVQRGVFNEQLPTNA